MFRRIEFIDSFANTDGTVDTFKHGLMGLSYDEVVEAWIWKLRGPDRTLPGNVRFYFTEKGWRQIGRLIVRACGQLKLDYRVIRIKENEIEVTWRDKHTGFEVAGQPRRPRTQAM